MTGATKIGAEGESAAAAVFIQEGCDVYIPAYGAPTSDLVVDIGGRMYRVQVKSSAKTDDVIEFRCRKESESANGRRYTEEDVDLFAFYSTHHGVVSIMTLHEAGGAPHLRYVGEGNERKARFYTVKRIVELLKENTDA